MSEFKMNQGNPPQDISDAVSIRSDASDKPQVTSDLPVNTYDDYKTWCDKIRQEWDIN